MIDSELVILLSDSDKTELLNSIEKDGYYAIKDIIKSIQLNANNQDFTLMDIDMIIIFDLHINYNMYVDEHNIYTRDQVIEKYNLDSFRLSPEQLFNHQQVEIIDSDYYIFDEECENRQPQKLYNTKIYIGKEKWKDFMITYRFMKSMMFISESRLAITNSEQNKESEKNKESKYIDKILERVLNNDT